MTKTFKVAAAQVRPVLFDLNGSLNKVLLKIQEAATKAVSYTHLTLPTSDLV